MFTIRNKKRFPGLAALWLFFCLLLSRLLGCYGWARSRVCDVASMLRARGIKALNASGNLHFVLASPGLKSKGGKLAMT